MPIVREGVVREPVVEIEVVPVPPNARVLPERLVVEAPPVSDVSPLKVSGVEVALPTKSYPTVFTNTPVEEL